MREMRRKKQALSIEACEGILRRGSSGVLALMGDGGMPYAVPLSYWYESGTLWFHSAKSGHKVDAARANPKVSFCVVDRDQVVPEEYTTYFRSVIVFGTIRLIEEEGEKHRVIDALAKKYAPEDSPESRERAIRREWAQLLIFALDVEHMTGKQAIELVSRENNDDKDKL